MKMTNEELTGLSIHKDPLRHGWWVLCDEDGVIDVIQGKQAAQSIIRLVANELRNPKPTAN